MEVQLKRPTPGNSQVIGDGKFDLLQAHHTVMMSCKGVPGKSLTVTLEGNAVGFATTDVKDAKQQWIKVEDRPMDQGRGPRKVNAFAIVNKATGKAIQKPHAAKLPVLLAQYNPNDTSQLWTATGTENRTDGGYSIIHEFVDTNLVLDAVHIILEAVHMVVVSNQHASDNQLWKFEQAGKA